MPLLNNLLKPSTLKLGNLPYKKFIVVAFIAAIFIGTAIVIYKKYVLNRGMKPQASASSSISPDNKAIPMSGEKTVDLYFFYTEWCPHCKKTKPEWAELKKQYSGGKKINGYAINFIDVDCEANPDLANQFKIEGYPTIKLVKGNQIIEFDAKPDYKTLEQFLTTVLSK
jgi:thiol-disulfide isomerase/thioredoxin